MVNKKIYKISFSEESDTQDKDYIRMSGVKLTTSKSGKTNTYTGTKSQLHDYLANYWGNFYNDKGSMMGTRKSPKAWYESKMKPVKVKKAK